MRSGLCEKRSEKRAEKGKQVGLHLEEGGGRRKKVSERNRDKV